MTELFWQVTVLIETEDEVTAKLRKVKEDWLVDAQSATEAEAKTLKHFEGTLGGYRVIKATQSKILDIIN